MSERPFVLWLFGDIYCSWTRLLLVRIRELQSGNAAKLELGWRPLPLRPENEAALRAVEFARDLDRELADRVLDGLCEAAAAGLLDALDPRSLLAVCERLGLDGEGVRHAVSDGRYDAELTRAEDEAERYGIDCVPTLLIGSRKIVGAAPTDLLAAEVEAQMASLPAENEDK